MNLKTKKDGKYGQIIQFYMFSTIKLYKIDIEFIFSLKPCHIYKYMSNNKHYKANFLTFWFFLDLLNLGGIANSRDPYVRTMSPRWTKHGLFWSWDIRGVFKTTRELLLVIIKSAGRGICESKNENAGKIGVIF